jgi:hypothetical protein
MTATFEPQRDRYYVCNQCGPYGMGYGTPTLPNCYGGDCISVTGSTSGPFAQCMVRERLRDFYADGVQGGSPACKSQRTDESGLFPPFQTYAVNYFGDNDVYRQRPYGGGLLLSSGSSCPSNVSASLSESYGHYVNESLPRYQEPLLVPPVPGVASAKTLDSMAWPGTQSVCTSKL